MGVLVMERTSSQSTEPSQEHQQDPGADERAIKVSVSMPGTLVQGVRDRVGKRQFSRYVAEAVERQLKQDQLGEIVDAYVAEHGPLDEDMIRKAEAEWHEAFGE